MSSLVISGDTSGTVTLAAPAVAGTTTLTLPATTGTVLNDATVGVCRAWVNFNGVTTATIRGSFNVSSVTRNTTGDFTVNFTNAMTDTNYSYVGVGRRNSATPLIIAFSIPNTTAYDPLTTSVRFQTRTDSSGAEDPLNFSVNVFR